MPNLAVISLTFVATSNTSSSLSTTHGPAMRTNGLLSPISIELTFTIINFSFYYSTLSNKESGLLPNFELSGVFFI